EVPQPPTESARAGSPDGSLAQGPVTGVEANPALPLVFPDPSIYPWQLPKGLQGDVIVEVTIDEHGSVTETKVVQSLQSDIDEKVIATLKNWHFRPASVDGVAISSRQEDRKSTRLNSSHDQISYAVFCLKKKICTEC